MQLQYNIWFLHQCSNVIHTVSPQGGPNEWLVVDKHLHDLTGQSCNKIGVTSSTVLGQENRCFQKEESYVDTSY